MNAAETITLLGYVTAACPAQKVDEFTPEAWVDLLGRLRYNDCKEAARNLAQSQDFIAPKDIIREVRRIRTRRLDEHGPFDPPDPDMTVKEYQVWLHDARTAIADGQSITQPALERRDLSALKAIDKRPA